MPKCTTIIICPIFQSLFNNVMLMTSCRSGVEEDDGDDVDAGDTSIMSMLNRVCNLKQQTLAVSFASALLLLHSPVKRAIKTI